MAITKDLSNWLRYGESKQNRIKLPVRLRNGNKISAAKFVFLLPEGMHDMLTITRNTDTFPTSSITISYNKNSIVGPPEIIQFQVWGNGFQEFWQQNSQNVEEPQWAERVILAASQQVIQNRKRKYSRKGT